MKRNLLQMAWVGVLATIGFSAWSQTTPYTIISTFNNYDGQAFGLQNNEQFGNIITLNQFDYDITGVGGGFEFEYYVPGGNWGLNPAASSVGVEINFYNVTSSGTPTTQFYSSGFFYNGDDGGNSIPSNGNGNDLSYTTTDFTGGDGPGAITIPSGYLMPTQFLFTIEFTGVTNNQVALPIAATTNSYPSTTQPDYLVNIGGVWTEYTNAVGNNALFSFTGVPEPTMMALSGIGSLLLLGAMKLKRKI